MTPVSRKSRLEIANADNLSKAFAKAAGFNF